MNTLTVEFHGICIHFNRDANPTLNLPAPHRIVLPFLPNGLEWDHQTILVHEPTVSVTDPRGVRTLAPKSVTLTLDTLTSQSGVTSTFQCPPNLRDVLPDMTVDRDVVVGHQAPATIYFDMHEGVLSGINIEGSAATRLTIQTELTEATLTMTEWGEGGKVSILPLQLPATIVVSNLAKDTTSDLAADFIISFAVGKPFPPPAHDAFLIALEKALDGAMTCVQGPVQDIGPGCSNSQFP